MKKEPSLVEDSGSRRSDETLPKGLRVYGVCNNLPVKITNDRRDYSTNNEGPMYSTGVPYGSDELHSSVDADRAQPKRSRGTKAVRVPPPEASSEST